MKILYYCCRHTHQS